MRMSIIVFLVYTQSTNNIAKHILSRKLVKCSFDVLTMELMILYIIVNFSASKSLIYFIIYFSKATILTGLKQYTTLYMYMLTSFY